MKPMRFDRADPAEHSPVERATLAIGVTVILRTPLSPWISILLKRLIEGEEGAAE